MKVRRMLTISMYCNHKAPVQLVPVVCTCVTAMAPAPVRPTSSKLAKVNFPTETVISFLLKYLIFKMDKLIR